jgi:hypothetical protein
MIKKTLLVTTMIVSNIFILNAETGGEIASKFEISASAKVSAIWEKIFEKKKWKKIFPRSKRSIYLSDFKELPNSDKERLKVFLIEHAADSAKPKIAGEM